MRVMSVLLVAAVWAFALLAHAAPLTDTQRAAIDKAVLAILKRNDVPSASIAVVTDGKLDYAKAYGDQRLDKSPPTTTARYPIASISKQFTAAAILLLVEDGKLSLDDKVATYLPTLTGADKVTIRQLLSHTSGYRDYWPQDFDFADMARPVTPMDILSRWAMAPLDYEPGAQRQYSNTGYVAAGLIVEKAAGEKLFAFQQRRIFKPLGMNVLDTDAGLEPTDARGFNRYALGKPRPTTPTAPGWLFATGHLAVTPSDLAKWNIARINRSILKANSWEAQETDVTPKKNCQRIRPGRGDRDERGPSHDRAWRSAVRLPLGQSGLCPGSRSDHGAHRGRIFGCAGSHRQRDRGHLVPGQRRHRHGPALVRDAAAGTN